MFQVKVEMVSQIAEFKRLVGHLPQYVDGHLHVHILPGNKLIMYPTVIASLFFILYLSVCLIRKVRHIIKHFLFIIMWKESHELFSLKMA